MADVPAAPRDNVWKITRVPIDPMAATSEAAAPPAAQPAAEGAQPSAVAPRNGEAV